MSTERPTKKVRLNISQSTRDHNVVQAISSHVNQMANPTNIQSRSPICELPSPILALVCGHLGLEFKCRSLPVLCKLIKALFQPALCCRGSSLSIRFNAERRFSVEGSKYRYQTQLNHNLARLALVPYAARICLEIDDPEVYESMPELREYIIDMLLTAVKSTRLISLTLSDIVVSSNLNIASSLIAQFNHLKHHHLTGLKELGLKLGFVVCDELTGDEFVDTWNNVVDWSGLTKCHALQHFSLLTPSDEFGRRLLSSLPDSVNTLSLACAPSYVDVLNDLLSNPKWLSFLKNLHSLQHSIDCMGVDDAGDECLTRLQSLQVNMWSEPTYHYASNDLSPIISFASKRAIRELSVVNQRGSGSLKIQAWTKLDVLSFLFCFRLNDIE